MAPGLRDGAPRHGAPRHHSVDSEDDDYYDNQILPFYESHTQLNDRNKNIGEPISASGSNKTAQETDRLKSQLKEAYYLLINTMHDISFDGQVEDNGFVDQASSASRSNDSVSTGSDASEQHQNDSDSPLFIGQCGVGLTGSSQSLQNICNVNPKPTLQRSVSDSKVKYSFNREEEPRPAVVSGCAAHMANPMETLAMPVSTRQSCDDATVPKHPGVTVNKMQEWMQKGRMLSSEMKQRIAGSSLRANHVRLKTVRQQTGMDARCRGGHLFHLTTSRGKTLGELLGVF